MIAAFFALLLSANAFTLKPSSVSVKSKNYFATFDSPNKIPGEFDNFDSKSPVLQR
jgi:hypothetical protein